MFDAFISGAVAGYAIAIPVGAITLLILETSLQRGFWAGFAAASGAATADLIYASIASTLGTVLAAVLEPIAPILKWVSAAFLVALGAWGLWKIARVPRLTQTDAAVEARRVNLGQTYSTLLGLTLLNPATVAYFAALILGLNASVRLGIAEKSLFVLGAFLASWSWQTLLAGSGALAHKHLPASFRRVTNVAGNCIIILLGVKILF